MAEIFRMPSVSPTMETGQIVAWRLNEGDRFEAGAVIAEVATDKATMEAEIFDEGVLRKQLVAEGDDVPLGAPMAIFSEDPDEDIDALVAEAQAELKQAMEGGGSPESTGEAPAEPEPEAADDQDQDRDKAPPEPKQASEPAKPKPSSSGSAPSRATLAQRIERTWEGKALSPNFMEPPGDIGAASVEDRAKASPLARKRAEKLGVSLSDVEGSGPRGRILRDDVEAAAKAAPTAQAAPAAATRSDEHVKHSPMRRTIAKRLLESHQQIPTFFLTRSFDGAGMVALRDTMKAQVEDLRVSYNDILLACVARALREYPEANASWGDKGITRHGRVDLGVAVALPQGLITPVIRNADQLRLSELAGQVRDLAGRAKEGKLKEDEYTGGTFTVSNLGMFGIDHFTAIINPPEAAILAVGAMKQVPVVDAGTKPASLSVGWRMNVTMTCDHRVIDGAVGAQFLGVLQRYVESPALLLV